MSSWSPKDDQSTKSWRTPYVSPSVTWGTLPTTTSASSSGSCLQAIDHNTAWSPLAPYNVPVGSPTSSQGWASTASSPLYPSLSYSPSAASYGGYPSPPPVSSSVASGSWTQFPYQLNPLLDFRSSQCLNFDIGALQYMPNLNGSGPAVHPPVTFMQLLIIAPPFKWPVNIQVHGSVTVSQIVQQLYEFLQGHQNAHDLQKSKVQIPATSYGHHSPSLRDNPNGFHSGRRRIDFLGPNRIFRGLSPEPGPNNSGCAWVVHLSDR